MLTFSTHNILHYCFAMVSLCFDILGEKEFHTQFIHIRHPSAADPEARYPLGPFVTQELASASNQQLDLAQEKDRHGNRT